MSVATAVVCTYLPDEDRVYHTPFSSEHLADPLTAAHAFRDAEEERGDFPGAIWGIVANDAARDIRRANIMSDLFSEAS